MRAERPVGEVLAVRLGAVREIAAACAACALLASASARGSEGDDLFERGRDLLDCGLVSEACETLAKAEVASPSVGTIGLLAACHEKQGRLATAWREYRDAARRAAAAHDARERVAADRAAKLEPTVPRLVLHLPANESLRVEVGGRELDASTLAAAVRLDPGTIEVTATSPTGKRWSTRVTLDPGEERVVAVPSLAAAPAPAAARAAPPTATRRGSPWPALVAGGAGVASLGLMAGLGLTAASKSSDSTELEARCRGGQAPACTTGRRERDDARSFGDGATVAFVVGTAALGAGVFFWTFDVGRGETRAAMGVGPGGAALMGAF